MLHLVSGKYSSEFFSRFVLDDSDSDEHGHDVDDENTSQEPSSNKDTKHDGNSYQPQNRLTFYSNGKRNMILLHSC